MDSQTAYNKGLVSITIVKSSYEICLKDFQTETGLRIQTKIHTSSYKFSKIKENYFLIKSIP